MAERTSSANHANSVSANGSVERMVVVSPSSPERPVRSVRAAAEGR